MDSWKVVRAEQFSFSVVADEAGIKLPELPRTARIKRTSTTSSLR